MGLSAHTRPENVERGWGEEESGIRWVQCKEEEYEMNMVEEKTERWRGERED